MTYADLDRAFPFRVRPLRDETIDSLTRRVLTANAEPADLPRHLLSAHGLSDADWPSVLHQKNASAPARSPVSTGAHHADGTTCEQCTDLLTQRFMCTHCSHGHPVEQEPHFRAPVCARHRRWTGFDASPDNQHDVSRAHVRAARRFDTLRRTGRIDVRLYGLVVQHLTAELAKSEADLFPAAVGIISDLTDPALLRRLLDPRRTFAQAHTLLRRTVATRFGEEPPATIRALWLALRPAFAASRSAARTGAACSPSHPHDFPVHTEAVKDIPHMREREPFTAFLTATGDTPESANAFLGNAYQRLVPGTGRRRHVCPHGHEFVRATSVRSPRCPDCPRGGAATPGSNDIASQSPRLLAEWDHERNAPLTPSMVAVHSGDSIHWLCSKGHSYPATPSNRTLNDQGCAVCQNRRILPGFNDFATRYPKKFGELSPNWLSRYDPIRHTPASKVTASWTCQAGHEFKATFKQRADGRNCDQCRRLRSVAKRGSLADKHPLLAAEWVEEANTKTPHDYSPGSKMTATWRCHRGHEYPMRIERRVAGGGCKYCANRVLLTGFNDFATLHPRIASEWHPYQNWTRPFEVFPMSNKTWTWRCINGHEMKRSTVHRIASGGCTECPRDERAAYRRPL